MADGQPATKDKNAPSGSLPTSTALKDKDIPNVSPSTSTSTDPPPIPRAILSFIDYDFGIGTVGEFRVRAAKYHQPYVVSEVSGNVVLSARAFEMTLTQFLEDPKPRVYNPFEGLVRARSFTSCLIKGMLQCVSCLFKRGLCPSDLTNTDNWLIFLRKPKSCSERFSIPESENIHYYLTQQGEYNPETEVCIINCRRGISSFTSQAHHIKSLTDLIFLKILGKNSQVGAILDFEWADLESQMNELYKTAFRNQNTNEAWKVCEAHAVFMFWRERKALIDRMYDWYFHSSVPFLVNLITDAFSFGELRNLVITWIDEVRQRNGVFLKVLNFRSTPYQPDNLEHFLQYFRNFACHVSDRVLFTGSYKNIDTTDPTEKFFTREANIYIHLTYYFPPLFVRLNEYLIRRDAPPPG